MTTLQTVYGRFLETAARFEERIALLSGDRPSTSFGELRDSVERARRNLHTHGLGVGSRIGFLVSDRPSAGVAHLLACATGTSVPLSPELTPDELREMTTTLRIDAILVEEHLPEALKEVAATVPVGSIPIRLTGKTGLFDVPSGDAAGPSDDRLPGPDDVAVLLLTSGTTSKPKIVPQTNGNRYATSTRQRHDLAIGPSDRCLNLMPLHHTQGLSAEFLNPLTNGASVAFDTFNPAAIVEQVEKYGPTWFNLVPSMHQSVLQQIGDARGVFKDSTLRHTRSSSAKLLPDLKERLEQAYGVPVVESYGATETSNIANTGLRPEHNRPGSVGRPTGIIMIADPEGKELPVGERGEICVSGPTVIAGYENDPVANAEKFRDGWYRTGDEGYLDSDGFLYVTGRLQEVVNRGGEKFSLAEIDEVLSRVEGVRTGAAFTVVDSRLGHEVYAAVVLAEATDASPASIRSELSRKLSWARVPKRVFVVSELPVNGTGKVMRDRLAADLVGKP